MNDLFWGGKSPGKRQYVYVPTMSYCRLSLKFINFLGVINFGCKTMKYQHFNFRVIPFFGLFKLSICWDYVFVTFSSFRFLGPFGL